MKKASAQMSLDSIFSKCAGPSAFLWDEVLKHVVEFIMYDDQVEYYKKLE